jgi:transketolase
MIAKYGRKTKCIVTAENHTTIGGLGDAVAAELASQRILVGHKKVGLKDQFAEGGSIDYLNKKYNLEVEDIVNATREVLVRD